METDQTCFDLSIDCITQEERIATSGKCDESDNVNTSNTNALNDSSNVGITQNNMSSGFEQESVAKLKISSKKASRVKMEMFKSEWLRPFELGWRREIVQRNANNESSGGKGPMCDVYYFSPEGKKMRSNPEIAAYLIQKKSPLTTDCFTFLKEQIHREPHEIMRTAGQSKKFYDRGNATTNGDNLTSTDNSKCTPSKVSPAAAAGCARKDKTMSKLVTKETETPMSTKSLNSSVERKSDMNLVTKRKLLNVDDSAEAKRIRSDSSEAKQTKSGSVEAKQSNSESIISVKTLEAEPAETKHRLCSLLCPGRENFPPSLPCQICMCMFHPECIGVSSLTTDFTCQACVIDFPGINPELNNNSKKNKTTSSQLSDTKHQTINNLPNLVLGHQIIIRPPPPAVISLGNNIVQVIKSAPSSCGSLRPTHVTNPLLFNTGCNKVMLSVPVEPPKLLNISNVVFENPQNISNTAPTQILSQIGQIMHVTNVQESTNPKYVRVIQSIGDGINKATDFKSELHGDRKRRKYVDTPQWKRAFSQINKLHSGFDAILCIFRYLSVPERLRAGMVCHTWRSIVSMPCMWQVVKLQNCRVTDWIKAAKWFRHCNTRVLDLRKNMTLNNESCHMFVNSMQNLPQLCNIELGASSADTVELIASQLKHLRFFCAEFMSESNNAQQLIPQNVCLDLNKFTEMKDLEVLRLRAIYGLNLSLTLDRFNNQLQLGGLQMLKTLALTTLRRLPGKNLSFIGSLNNLEILELGDCYFWDRETYEALGRLVNLRMLRLESGGEDPDLGLGEALLKMKKLRHLELIKYMIGENLSLALQQLVHLQTFHIWSEFPEDEIRKAHMNCNTLSAVCRMPFLRNLDWGAVAILNRAEMSPCETQEDSIFVTLGDEGNKDCTKLKCLTLTDLASRLKKELPTTKVRLFKVPLLVFDATATARPDQTAPNIDHFSIKNNL